MELTPSIFVIDDDPDFLTILTYVVEAIGYNLSTETCAKTAIDRLKVSPVDLIFCDLRLSGSMDGFEFARAVSNHQHLARIPLIAITGFKEETIIQKARDTGFDEVLTKPIKFKDIREVVRRHIEHDLSLQPR